VSQPIETTLSLWTILARGVIGQDDVDEFFGFYPIAGSDFALFVDDFACLIIDDVNLGQVFAMMFCVFTK
jgi:hypothetical protein